MKKLLSVLILTLSLSSLAAVARADEGYQRGTHLMKSGVHQDVTGTPDASHYFELHVGANSLSQIELDVPKGITIPKRVEIEDKSGAKVSATVSTNERRVSIAFIEPVAPGKILSVTLEGINVPRLGNRIWLYPIYGRFVGLTTDIRLGTVRVQSFR